MNTFNAKVIDWAGARGILANSSPTVQFAKLVSEVGELADNIAKGRDVKDDIGDCMVVLAIIAAFYNTTLNECARTAWEDIKDRKGYLNSDGIFIKEGDNG
ncbi:transcriptional repressor [Roseobacter phage CRP-143]|nr:transcriptional repressor [Roseobacter phage CRP-143]